jgi:menaquinone-dependent protoporphyrinogen oxidase
MKTLIFYRSLTGSTTQYAQWLAEETGGELLSYRQAKPDLLSSADAVVVMSGTYASFMPLVGFLKKNWPRIQGKKVAAVAVGVVPPEDQGSRIAYERIPQEIRTSIKYWKLPGKMGQNKSFGELRPDNLKPVIDYLRS